MNLNGEQNAFLLDVAKLIEFVRNTNGGMLMTTGRAYSTQEEQAAYYKAKLSMTMNSNHCRRLAQDFNFIKNGEMVTGKEALSIYGDFWESLSPENRWGGNFSTIYDPGHFERNVL
jgi:hypothetical protein